VGMQPLLREQAEVLALVIEHGLAEPAEAVTWACQLVSEQEHPSEATLELAGALRPHFLDVLDMLRRFPGTADPVRVFRSFLARARDLVHQQPEAWSRITIALEQMALRGEAPEVLGDACRSFDDERLLAENGTYGSVHEVRAELIAFLEVEALP
jgi:hypothetical protein